ncbi:MAG: M28 family peptidase [Pyrinomonadaceae bacterium]
MNKKLSTFLLVVGMLVPSLAFGQTVKVSSDERKMAEEITAGQLSNYLYFVASDAMGGRDTPSYGLDVTAEFLKMNLQKWGFKGAGDNGTFFQKMGMAKPKINAAGTTATIAGQQLTHGTDFLAAVNAGTVQNARLVFAGNGWFVKSKDLDPFKGLDVKGKIVVISGEGLPRGMTFQQLNASGQRGVDWIDPATYARQSGAVGLITLSTPMIVTNWERTRRQRETGGGFFVEKLRDAAVSFPTVTLNQKASDALLAGEGTDLAKINATSGDPVASFAFADSKTASLNVATDVERVNTQNVVALWEGSDPVLKNEMVAIGAHYDHVGTNPNAPGEDKIWNGADDDGSGTVAVLSIAEALAKGKVRPKRSILLVWHAGEEKGLLGAEYFNKFPTVNIKNVIAQLNIDMIGRSLDPNNVIKCAPGVQRCNENLSKANETYVIGAEMMSSTLGAITKGIGH